MCYLSYFVTSPKVPCQSVPLFLRFNQVKQLINSCLSCSFWHGIEPSVIFQNLSHSHIPVKGKLLKNNSYGLPYFLRLCSQIIPCNTYTSLLHRQESSKDIYYSTFPCPIWSEKREDTPFPDGKTDIIDCLYFAEKIPKAIYVYDIIFQNQYIIAFSLRACLKIQPDLTIGIGLH